MTEQPPPDQFSRKKLLLSASLISLGIGFAAFAITRRVPPPSMTMLAITLVLVCSGVGVITGRALTGALVGLVVFLALIAIGTVLAGLLPAAR